MYRLSIYDMSPRSIFHNLTWKFSAFYKFSENKQQQQNNMPLLQYNTIQIALFFTQVIPWHMKKYTKNIQGLVS